MWKEEPVNNLLSEISIGSQIREQYLGVIPYNEILYRRDYFHNLQLNVGYIL